MNISSQPLLSSASQPLKLPIPRLPTSSSTSSNWSSSASAHSIVPNETQQIDNITQQRTTNKPQNKRGRKPLSSMPTAKKHVQNLTNQRAFRQRRETYIRSLESKASKFEMLLKDARNEVESLREQVALLEKRVDIEEGINICNSDDDLQVTISDENIRINDIIHNDNINSFNNNNNDIKINNDDSGNQPSRCFTPFATTNTSPITTSFSFNDQHRLISQSPQISCNVPMLPPLETVEDVIREPIFCETKEGNLCLCEPDESTTTGIDKCLNGDKPVSGKRMMIFPKEVLSYPTATTVSSPLYSNYPPHWELSHQQGYFSPAVSSVVTTTTNSLTQIHPLHLKWILGDS